MENKWKGEFRKWVERAGGICFLIHGHGMQAPGIPDVWVATRWWCGWIEFKQGTNHLSTAQRIKGRALERFGAFAVVRFTKETMALENHDEQQDCSFERSERALEGLFLRLSESRARGL